MKKGLFLGIAAGIAAIVGALCVWKKRANS